MKARIVMIIHDALWAEAPLEGVEMARTLIEDTMKTTAKYPLVPLGVEFD